MIEIIIPVGPGHEQAAEFAKLSIQCAMDNYMFDDVRVVLVDDVAGKKGRSASRNMGAKASKADWIFWLDADDLVHPDIFLNAESVLSLADHDAIWGMVHQLDRFIATPRYELPRINDYATLIKYPSAWTVKIGHFVRPQIARDFPFNEVMNCAEDWDYYLRVWKKARCVKIPAPFYVKTTGNQSTGPKSANGADWSRITADMLETARQEYNQENPA